MVYAMTWSYSLAATICDLKYTKIPNLLILLGYVAGAFFNIWSYGLEGIAKFLFNAIWPILALYIVFWLGGLGAGDVKMISVLGPILEIRTTGILIILSLVIGAVYGAFIMIKDRKLHGTVHFSWCITCAYLLIAVKEGFIFETAGIAFM